MSYAIQNIFSQAYDYYSKSTSVAPEAHKVAVSIIRCKTALLGGNSAVCQDCGAAEVHYHSFLINYVGYEVTIRDTMGGPDLGRPAALD